MKSNRLIRLALTFPAVVVALLSVTELSAQNCPNITGQVVYLNALSSPVYGISVALRTAEGQVVATDVTDYQGRFSFCQTDAGSYTLTMETSLEPGGINATDALLALQHFVGVVNLQGMRFSAGDVNGSGYINSVDAFMILQRFAGLIQTFPAGDWLFEAVGFSLGTGESIDLTAHAICYGDLDVSFLPPACTPMPSQADAGPDQNVGSTYTTLAALVPLSGDGQWTVIDGTGGQVAEPSNPSSQFTGLQGTTYTLVWTVSTLCAGTSDTVTISFTDPGMGGPCPGLPSFEYEGQIYNTVQIGTQCWMRENLNVGSMIPMATVSSDNGVREKYCYNNDPANCAVYGAYYMWNEAMQYTDVPGSQGICPAGWHMPSQDDWCTLFTFLDPTVDCMVNPGNPTGTDAGGKMKEYGETHWQSPNTGATNESGFSALGAGQRFYYGVGTGLHAGAYLWSSSKNEGGFPLYWQLHYTNAQVARQLTGAGFGFSVRCVMDN
ncbi:MAG TPA: FISUMP domain-containing protein [Bacteroidales bacterium]|nr:FISUMP domain-containing protein [Bacteroidales bacterium]HSA42438.1 FISUMP domain-containing protein [Bacteroidales bacterium]